MERRKVFLKCGHAETVEESNNHLSRRNVCAVAAEKHTRGNGCEKNVSTSKNVSTCRSKDDTRKRFAQTATRGNGWKTLPAVVPSKRFFGSAKKHTRGNLWKRFHGAPAPKRFDVAAFQNVSTCLLIETVKRFRGASPWKRFLMGKRFRRRCRRGNVLVIFHASTR